MKIEIERLVHAGLDRVRHAYSNPDDIVQWNQAPGDRHTPRSTVDLREGGAFSTRMEARDGSEGFDSEGTDTRVVPKRRIDYRIADGREVDVRFGAAADGVRIRAGFDPHDSCPCEFRQQGWQSILDSFARHVETGAGALTTACVAIRPCRRRFRAARARTPRPAARRIPGACGRR